MNHLRLFVLLLILPVAASANDSPAMRVQIQSLTSAPLTRDLALSGTVRSLREAELSVATEALVKTIHVDVGARVTQGQVLLELDRSLMQREHERAKAEVAAAQIRADEAQRLYDEALKLRPQNHIAQTEVEARQSAATLAKAQLDQARADAGITAENLARHTLYAPFDGVISARWTELGQWLRQGDRAFTLVSLDDLRLDVRLPQEQLPEMEHLQSAHIRPDTHPNQQLAAQVDSLVPVGDQSRSLLLRLAVTEASETLFPGASAQALLHFQKSAEALVVPRDAVLRNADGNYSVFVVDDGIAKVRQITIGPAGGDGYRVEKGLQVGEKVVVRGNEVLRDGQAVKVLEQTPQASPQANASEQP